MSREKLAVHMDLQVGYVFVMKMGRLARAKCVPFQNAGLAALVIRDLGYETWHSGSIGGGANARQQAKTRQTKTLQTKALQN
jgi:hypothetical protein